MFRSYVTIAAPACALFLGACGPPLPPAVGAPNLDEAPASSYQEPEPAAVKRPASVMAWGGWMSPSADIDGLFALAGVATDWRQELFKEWPDGANVMQLDASLDFAVAVEVDATLDDPETYFAVSIPVSDIALVRGLIHAENIEVSELVPGIERMRKDDVICDLSASVGKASARLVCGNDDRGLNMMTPWLTRGLPLEARSTEGFYVEIDLANVKRDALPELRKLAVEGADQAVELMENELKVQDPELLEAPRIALAELVKFVEDVRGFRLHAHLDGSAKTARIGGSWSFQSPTSWLTRVLLDGNEAAGPPPEIFWHAPRDSSSAQFGRRSKRELWQGVGNIVSKATRALLEQSPLEPQFQRSIGRLIDTIPISHADWATSSGSSTSYVAPLTGAVSKQRAVTHATAMAQSYVGWYVWGTDGPAEPYTTWFEQVRDLHRNAIRIAEAMAAPDEIAELKKFAPDLNIDRSPTGYPAGTMLIELLVHFDSELVWEWAVEQAEDGSGPDHPAGAPAKGTMAFYLAIVPDGPARTWIGVAADKRQLLKKMKSVLRSAPVADTIASRDDLSLLRGETLTSGGFAVLDNRLETLAQDVPEVKDLLAQLPNKGATPIFFLGTGKAGAVNELGFEIRLQPGTVEDLAKAVGMLPSAISEWSLEEPDDAIAEPEDLVGPVLVR